MNNATLPLRAASLTLPREGIKYFAGSVLKSKIFQLKQRSDSSRYLHILAFISHQFYRLQDNLVDILLTVVKTFQNACQKQSKEQHYERRKVQADNVEKFISSVDGNLGLIKSIKDVTESSFSDAKKVLNIKELLARKDNHLEVEEAKVLLEDSFSSVDHEKIMESRAKRLQNRASQIIKILNFSSEKGATALLKAIQCYKEKNGRVDDNFPKGFLSEEQLVAINKSGEFSRPLYKVFLFCEIANSLKSGMLNLVSSYKYQPLDKYLINKDRWIKNRSDLLRKANMQSFESPKKVLSVLHKTLSTSYKHTNKEISSKKNPYFKKLEKGFIITTPAKDEEDHEPLQGYFPETQFIPLTEILYTVNESCNFMEEIGHWQQRRTRTTSKKSIFASIVGLGCGIGTRKMAQISTSVSENEIEHAVNWYLSLDNLRSANDRIVRFMDTMELPNLYRKNKDKLHTASDGQKFTVRADSLNANYSFKYGGKEQVSTAYSFIDERNLLWYSLVFSAADRESAYVLDGLMHNDVVKSDIHSTDTHGYSEAIFGIAYILGFSYAPRIKNLKRQTLYTFRRIEKDPKWSVQASKYVDENLICKYWDDLLRLVCTIKLKETTASDIFRRLNSYSKQHELYKTIKAFGQIIKSDFILKYLDDLELRQAIEKQLNKVELANKFTRAVAIGSPREYKQGSKEEQEVTESCNRLIKNAIICWNYMFLEKRLKKLPEGNQKETLMTAIKNHSPISWAHINLLGEYDFSENKMKDSQGILSTKKVIF
ncbi:MAG: Tn3 family transposase [Lentisphaeraceae bacterium]|nr:Tn3 family transposase [Lentisphaeraceae bacterium]